MTCSQRLAFLSGIPEKPVGDIHGGVQDPDQDDAVLHRAVEQDEPVHVPTSEVGGQLRTGPPYLVIGGQHVQLFIEQPDDHFGVLRTVPRDVVLNRDVVLPALPGLQNPWHGALGSQLGSPSGTAGVDDFFCGEFDEISGIGLSHTDGNFSPQRGQFGLLFFG